MFLQGDELSRLQREWAEEKLQLTSHSSKLQTELVGKESQLNMATERLIQVHNTGHVCMSLHYRPPIHMSVHTRSVTVCAMVHITYLHAPVAVSTLYKMGVLLVVTTVTVA